MNTQPLPLSGRELTYEERSTFGVCPVCSAAHGEKCDPSKGFHLGLVASADGVHFGRLNAAPKFMEVRYHG